LRTPAEKSDAGLDDQLSEETAVEEETEDEEVILCRNCHAMITSPSERIMVDGLHRHTFANPHGIVFEIGCFRNAGGCTYTGPITDEFSWFKGYHWQIAICGECLQHMGWIFRSVDGGSFHGLVLDRLKSGTS
jgi:hypothetical protein